MTQIRRIRADFFYGKEQKREIRIKTERARTLTNKEQEPWNTDKTDLTDKSGFFFIAKNKKERYADDADYADKSGFF